MRRCEPCLIVLVGAPGSGKSTWANRNARGCAVVSQDDLIDAITPGGFDPGLKAVYAAAENAVAREALARSCAVIVDRTNRTRGHRARWTAMAAEFDCPALAVIMSASAELCRERNRRRTDHRRVTDLRMERMLAAMEPVGWDEGFSGIFSDKQTVEDIFESGVRGRVYAALGG